MKEWVKCEFAQVSCPAPSVQLSSRSDESLALLYLSHSDEVELMTTFTPDDVISVLRLGSVEVGEDDRHLLGASLVRQHTCIMHGRLCSGLHQLITPVLMAFFFYCDLIFGSLRYKCGQCVPLSLPPLCLSSLVCLLPWR